MRPRLRTALVGTAATIATVAAVLLPVHALHNTPALAASGAGPAALARSAYTVAAEETGADLGPCTVALDGTDWYFDPCLAVGDPLPQDVIDALAEVDRDRLLYPSDTPSPTEPTATGPPGPAPTQCPTATDTASPTIPPTTTVAGPLTRFPAGAHYLTTQTAATDTATATATGPTTAPPNTGPSTTAPPTTPSTTAPSTTAPSTTAPPTTAPSTTAPSTTAPSTTAPSTTAPPTTAPSTTAPSTTAPSGCPTFPTSEPTTPAPTDTPCESFDQDGNPVPCPTDTVTDPPPTTEPPTTEPPTTEPTSPTPTPTDTCAPVAAPPPDEKPILDSADKDKMGSRNPANIECGKRIVLTASGDSLTSAHHQWGFGIFCQRTSADVRGLTGNHAFFSYAGRYYNANANIVKYYNFARTGFGTTEMLGNPGARAADGCGNPWARAASPVGLSEAVIRQAKRDGYKAYNVSTGGVNNTNWTDVLEEVTKCRGLEWAQANLFPRGRSRFWWAAVGGKAGIVTNGGGCVLQVYNPLRWRRDAFIRIGVPRYNGGAATLAVITADVTAAVNKLLAAGADKIVWMLYHDITLANVDIANFAWTWVRGRAPAWVVGFLPPRIGALNVLLIDPVQAVASRGVITALNNAVIAGIPNNAKVATQASVVVAAADIQNTAIGGSPHPSAAGHTKMATALAAKFVAIP